VKQLHDHAAANEADDDAEPGFSEVFHVGVFVGWRAQFLYWLLYLLMLHFAAVIDRRI